MMIELIMMIKVGGPKGSRRRKKLKEEEGEAK